MRFYKDAFDYLLKAAEKKDVFDQHLYLVVEADNKHDVNAVMLHNGRQKLGTTVATEAPLLKRLMTNWKTGSRDDSVVVCNIDRIYINKKVDFPFRGSIIVHGKHRVNERLARKYADKFRKD